MQEETMTAMLGLAEFLVRAAEDAEEEDGELMVDVFDALFQLAVGGLSGTGSVGDH